MPKYNNAEVHMRRGTNSANVQKRNAKSQNAKMQTCSSKTANMQFKKFIQKHCGTAVAKYKISIE